MLVVCDLHGFRFVLRGVVEWPAAYTGAGVGCSAHAGQGWEVGHSALDNCR